MDNQLLLVYAPLLFLTFYIISHHFHQKLQNLPPSPFPTLPFIGHFHLLRQPLHRTLFTLSTRYGSSVLLLRFGFRSVVVVSSPSAAEECFTKNDVVFANRPKFLVGKIIGFNYTSLSWSSYGEHWRNLRKLSVIEVLSAHRIQMLSEIRADEARSLVRRLFRASKQNSDNVVEIKSAVYDYTFNVITRMISRKRYYGEKVENFDEAKIYKEMSEDMKRVVVESTILDYFPLLKWFGYRDIEKKMMKLHEKREKFMQNIIEQQRRRKKNNTRSESEVKKTTILEVLLALQKTDPHYYSDENIKSLMLVLLQAGSDTSATTLEWGFSYLLDNPRIINKARAEIHKQVEHNRLIKESDLPKLPYIRAIVNETLRMQPAAPLLVPHFSSEECILGGFRIPRGTILLVNAWGIHHDPKVWEDPETFKPERFEGKLEYGYKFIPFGSGRRSCPGESLAQRVIELALGLLLQCFDWEKLGNNKDMIGKSESCGFFATKVEPLLAKCSPRHDMLITLSQI